MSDTNNPVRHETPRFLSEADCLDAFARAKTFAVGNGETGVRLESTWAGNTRYARNRISTSGDIRSNEVFVDRAIRGAAFSVECNSVEDSPLEAAIRRSERLLRLWQEGPDESRRMLEHYVPFEPPHVPSTRFRLDSAARDSAMQSLIQSSELSDRIPKIFFETTFGFDANQRAATVGPLIQSARESGMMAAGYIEVAAKSRSLMTSSGWSKYFPYTASQYTVTVRDPKGVGSGWAGVDWADWNRVEADKLTAIAIDKCLKSRNPVRVEPGRYTAILEPQAVCDLCASIVAHPYIVLYLALQGQGPYAGLTRDSTKIGLRLFDERLTVTADPMDPDLGFPPFDLNGNVYHDTTWVEHGVLKNLAYSRGYARHVLNKELGMPSSGAFRMSGGTTTINEMVESTKRGVLVTRFSDIRVIDPNSLLSSGYTRDGLWLIENGKITKPIKNFRITESPMFILNNIEQLGVPQRVFHPSEPVVVPPLKVRDFSFTGTSDAI